MLSQNSSTNQILADLLQPSVKPMKASDLQGLLNEIADAYDRAQDWAKKYEVTFNQVPIACINQMRNAGYHLCRLIKSSNLTNAEPDVNLDELRSVYKHLLRAYYDVLDEFTKKISELLNDIESSYHDLLLSPVDFFKDFYTWKDQLFQLNSFDVVENQAVLELATHTSKRKQHYDRITAQITQLLHIHSQIRHMTDRLVVESNRIDKEESEKQKVEQRAEAAEKRADTAEKRQKNQFWIGIVTGIGGLIFTILLFLFGNKVMS